MWKRLNYLSYCWLGFFIIQDGVLNSVKAIDHTTTDSSASKALLQKDNTFLKGEPRLKSGGKYSRSPMWVERPQLGSSLLPPRLYDFRKEAEVRAEPSSESAYSNLGLRITNGITKCLPQDQLLVMSFLTFLDEHLSVVIC